MSGRLAFIRRIPRNARSIRIGVAFGLLAGCLTAAASPPAEPVGGDKVDDRLPIPPENSKQTVDAARFRIDKDKAIFTGLKDAKTGVVKGGIEDDRPLASEKQN